MKELYEKRLNEMFKVADIMEEIFTKNFYKTFEKDILNNAIF